MHQCTRWRCHCSTHCCGHHTRSYIRMLLPPLQLQAPPPVLPPPQPHVVDTLKSIPTVGMNPPMRELLWHLTVPGRLARQDCSACTVHHSGHIIGLALRIYIRTLLAIHTYICRSQNQKGHYCVYSYVWNLISVLLVVRWATVYVYCLRMYVHFCTVDLLCTC